MGLDPDEVAAAVRSLDGDLWRARSAAARALRDAIEGGLPPAATPVAKLVGMTLFDEHVMVRHAARGALTAAAARASDATRALLGSLPALSSLDATGKERALRLLGDLARAAPGETIHEVTCRAAIGALADDAWGVRAAALGVLADLGLTAHPARRAVLGALVDGDHAVRVAAADALGRLGPLDDDAVVALETTLRSDAQAEVRAAAAVALGLWALRPATGLEAALVSGTRDHDRAVREASAEALGMRAEGSPAAIRALVALVWEADFGVREAAIDALDNQAAAGADVVDLLLPLAANASAAIRVGVLRVLDRRGERGPVVRAALHDNEPRVREAAALLLAGADSPDLALLAHTLQMGTPGERRRAALALAVLGSGGAEIVPVLTGALRDPSDAVRRDACTALGQVGLAARPGTGGLVRRVAEQGSEVRLAAGVALARLLAVAPAATRTWLAALVSGESSYAQLVHAILDVDGLDAAARSSLVAVFRGRERWYRGLSPGAVVDGAEAGEEGSPWDAARLAVDAAAEWQGHRARNRRRKNELVEAARRREHAWQLARICAHVEAAFTF